MPVLLIRPRGRRSRLWTSSCGVQHWFGPAHGPSEAHTPMTMSPYHHRGRFSSCRYVVARIQPESVPPCLGIHISYILRATRRPFAFPFLSESIRLRKFLQVAVLGTHSPILIVLSGKVSMITSGPNSCLSFLLTQKRHAELSRGSLQHRLVALWA